MTAVAAGCSAEGLGPGPGDAASQNGPLSFTNGRVTYIMYPLGAPSFATFPVCSTDGPHRVTLVSLTPDKVTGPGAGIDFRVAWLEPGQTLARGGGKQSQLEEPFGPFAGTSGTVESCEQPLNSLEVAVLLPDADTSAVVVDGVDVVYEVDGRRHAGRADVVYGVCASTPADPSAQPEPCREDPTG